MTQTHEWQPIETAPVETPVLLGKYVSGFVNDALEWRTTVGAAWEMTGWWIFRSKARPVWTNEYTHWKPLPAAPGGAA